MSTNYCELFDPAKGTWYFVHPPRASVVHVCVSGLMWHSDCSAPLCRSLTGALATGAVDNGQAVTLQNGKVLFAGGLARNPAYDVSANNDTLRAAQLYDPATETW